MKKRKCNKEWCWVQQDFIKSKYNMQQFKMFKELKEKIKDVKIKYHILNSGGLFNYSNFKYEYRCSFHNLSFQ